MSGGSVKISLSCGWLCMRYHFLMSIIFKSGKAGWYCVTKGSIFLRAFLFLFSSDAFLSVNLTSERCFSTMLDTLYSGFRCVSKFFIFSSKVKWEEFVLRSLNASPSDKAFRDAWWVTREEIRVLKVLCRFVVCLHVKDWFLVESVAFVHFRVQECNVMETVCLANKFFYFTHAYVPQREHVVNKLFPH